MNPKVLNIKKVSMIIDTKPKSAQHYCCWVKNTNDLAETALSNATGWRETRDSAFAVLLDLVKSHIILHQKQLHLEVGVVNYL